jgi:hypothetical protein
MIKVQVYRRRFVTVYGFFQVLWHELPVPKRGT